MQEPKTWSSNLQAMIAGIRAKYLIFELTNDSSIFGHVDIMLSIIFKK
jgi:hypothetical protein